MHFSSTSWSVCAAIPVTCASVSASALAFATLNVTEVLINRPRNRHQYRRTPTTVWQHWLAFWVMAIYDLEILGYKRFFFNLRYKSLYLYINDMWYLVCLYILTLHSDSAFIAEHTALINLDVHVHLNQVMPHFDKGVSWNNIMHRISP